MKEQHTGQSNINTGNGNGHRQNGNGVIMENVSITINIYPESLQSEITALKTELQKLQQLLIDATKNSKQ